MIRRPPRPVAPPPVGVAAARAAARVATLAAALAAASPAGAQAPFESRFTGDVGAAVYARTETVRDAGGSVLVLPYVYGDYGRLFGRIDTFGVKTAALGAGHLELVLRISTEGFDADGPALRGLSDRRNPLPVGVGTYQLTPIGAFFVYAMHDLTSGGAFVEASWAARWDAGPVSLYPLLGVEYRGAAYVRHLYGVDAAEAAASGLAAYRPGASIVPMAGIAATVPLSGAWALQLQWRHRWLDGAIADSPIVASDSQHSGHVGLTWTFR